MKKPEQNECLGGHGVVQSGIIGIKSRRNKDRNRNWHRQQRKQITYEKIKRLGQRILHTQRAFTEIDMKEIRDVTPPASGELLLYLFNFITNEQDELIKNFLLYPYIWWLVRGWVKSFAIFFYFILQVTIKTALHLQYNPSCCIIWSHLSVSSPIDWGSRMHWVHLCKRLRPTKSVLNVTLNHLMVRLQSWSFEVYGVSLNCHHSQAHPDPT